uniref:Transposase n=1 Tax=Anguilla anguilla TaxID=7936 RepID=A0A0E9WDE3_ANGAN
MSRNTCQNGLHPVIKHYLKKRNKPARSSKKAMALHCLNSLYLLYVDKSTF